MTSDGAHGGNFLSIRRRSRGKGYGLKRHRETQGLLSLSVVSIVSTIRDSSIDGNGCRAKIGEGRMNRGRRRPSREDKIVSMMVGSIILLVDVLRMIRLAACNTVSIGLMCEAGEVDCLYIIGLWKEKGFR